MGLTKGLPYGTFMKHVIYDITEKGQLYQMKKKWENEKPDCIPLKNTGRPLTMQKMSMAFVLIISGIVLALLSLLFEITFSLYTPKSSLKDFSQNHPKLRICLNQWKARYEKARYPELFSLITNIENYLDFGQIQPSSMYTSIAKQN